MCHVNGRAQGNVRPHPLARGVAAVAAARSVAKPPVSLQVGLYNIGWTDSQLSGAFEFTTSIDIQAYVLGLYALVLDKSVC